MTEEKPIGNRLIDELFDLQKQVTEFHEKTIELVELYGKLAQAYLNLQNERADLLLKQKKGG